MKKYIIAFFYKTIILRIYFFHSILALVNLGKYYNFSDYYNLNQAANVKFLDRGIANGDNFILSALDAKEGASFYKELQYMYKRGYKPAADGMSLIKK